MKTMRRLVILQATAGKDNAVEDVYNGRWWWYHWLWRRRWLPWAAVGGGEVDEESTRARMMMIMRDRACSVEKRQATLLSSGFIFFSLVGVA